MRGEPIVERAFRILGAFAEAGEGLPLHLLAARAGLSKSTTYRIAAQLRSVGALERLENGDFVVGLQLLEIASLAPRGHGLRAAALPYMEDLHRVTHQHILLAVRDGEDAVLVERLSARDAAPVKYRVGGRLPLAQTGIGIALLAHAPEQVRREALDGAPDSSRVRRFMAAVLREGVCAMTGVNPLHAGAAPVGAGPASMVSVAAPILNRRGDCLGALSLVAPDEGRSQVAARIALRTASLAISRSVGS
ncbi:helix-turn-helix domain-containing protein [Pseudonocardia xishanensis]|uniref:Helix-turn-helix domain-containing protein n=1 Tax=Pseudonocardia xishanensis TaxID=630995 RepID=A0ABP8RRJ8_9PSEU